MSRYDRYVLSQFLLFFGFFALILVAVFWINRAVVLFDKLIGDGQSAFVFLEFTALTLPNLIRMVLPIAAFAASVFVTNRLKNDSELTVMQATGSSPWRLARPVFVFGLIAAAMMSMLTHVLLPASIKQLAIREAEVARNVTARLLSEGSFLHPASGVTFYIRQIDADGTLNDVFLSDRRNPKQSVIYTGSKAFLVRNGDQSNLIMVDGLAQSLDEKNNTLSTTVFADFSYDISSLINKTKDGTRNIRAIPTLEMINGGPQISEQDGYSAGQIADELHLRFARALICVAVTLIGYSALLLGSFSRFGVWRQAMVAFVILVFLEVLRGLVADPVLENPDLWPLIYLPTVLGIIIAVLFIQFSSRPLSVLWRRRPKVGGVS
ncbi:LPS export ABC transporter permease LptF [Phaeobacter gallaeciensis]|uniref:LPS export ABC transporter permease LptF n=2 Tax=Roseobacteraceae TaxID=2854170 RepID=A0A366WSW2_9RHOB|nr:LPS export ABC transporter permease LptF [Phaeobacter gallaeciensis]MBT3140789.1 LPS export ABC transporter permease LptF [Falsiruegeria litorea]MBT8170533.1 LPS export ABC transporter permease LptF [Falsiruegeria litorea]RBW52954.1 LPS export ABC transporter permease LptF [Phaeobacter gallaeciensis]